MCRLSVSQDVLRGKVYDETSPLDVPRPLSAILKRVPELPEVEATRRLLAPAMRHARFDRVLLRRANLRRAFAPDFADRVTGATVLEVGRRAKHLLLPLSTGDTLLMHLGMTGDFRVEHIGRPAGELDPAALDPHDHVVFEMSSGWVVTFNDPRRFGAMDLLTPAERASHPTLTGLGPEPLARTFTGTTLARACAGKRTSLKVALLDQCVVAGLGNIYAAEALHLAGLSPRRLASTIATPGGAARPAADRLATAIKTVLRRAVARQSRGDYRSDRFRVYDREGEPCVTTGCHGRVSRVVQAGRSTFYCRACQH
jgi:formamidopyrimidine-DNA glycosylase